ncbi:MAG TPA: acyl carrier protein [Aquabacterium sp.]|nr:acyl carrier protein [Aquabacterium sp.]
MALPDDLRSLLDRTLNLDGRPADFDRDTALMGALPELDSMGVVAVITAFEDIFGFAVDDDEIDGSVFQTFGSLLDFVSAKLGG